MPKFNLLPHDLKQIKQIIHDIAPSVDVWAYGSRVSGHCHASSDLDLVVRDPQNLDQKSAHLIRLKQAFRDSSLPILIDLVDWASLPSSYQTEILKGYVVIHQGRLFCQNKNPLDH